MFDICKFIVEYSAPILLIFGFVTIIIGMYYFNNSIKLETPIFMFTLFITSTLILLACQNYILDLKQNEQINYYELINYEKVTYYENNEIYDYYLITYLKNGKEITNKVRNSDWYIEFYNTDNYKKIVEIKEYEDFSITSGFIQKVNKEKRFKYKIFE